MLNNGKQCIGFGENVTNKCEGKQEGELISVDLKLW